MMNYSVADFVAYCDKCGWLRNITLRFNYLEDLTYGVDIYGHIIISRDRSEYL